MLLFLLLNLESAFFMLVCYYSDHSTTSTDISMIYSYMNPNKLTLLKEKLMMMIISFLSFVVMFVLLKGVFEWDIL